MPLIILLPMVFIGIAGIAVLLHLLGLSKPVRFDTKDKASKAWLREFPEDRPSQITLCPDSNAALIVASQGRGMVWAMGADSTARYLDGARVSRLETGLRIDLHDVTAPRIHLRLIADDIPVWIRLLKSPT